MAMVILRRRTTQLRLTVAQLWATLLDELILYRCRQ